MKDDLYNIKERILDVAVKKKIPKSVLCQKIGMTYASFKGSAKTRPLNSKAIADILMLYPDIDARWLLTGKGSMINKEFVE